MAPGHPEPSPLLVTGGTGLAGSTVALLAARQGLQVRALVRGCPEVTPLTDAGVEIVQGDICDPDSLDRAMRGASGVIHTAAALGGTWSKNTPDDMWRVNHGGALNVLDAAARAGVRRTVLIDSQSVIDPAFTQTERSPVVLISDLDSAYVQSKRAMFYAAMHRASLGQDVAVVTPGAIYGPGAFVERSCEPSSFNSVLLRGVTGALASYLSFPMMWTYVPDLAEICLRALSGGRIGRRYLAMGEDSDVSTIAEFCNQGAFIAGLPARCGISIRRRPMPRTSAPCGSSPCGPMPRRASTVPRPPRSSATGPRPVRSPCARPSTGCVRPESCPPRPGPGQARSETGIPCPGLNARGML